MGFFGYLFLIGIGFFLAVTGSLNITDISNILNDSNYSRIVATAIVFFLTGAILKMAFFPMHFWMVRAYSSAAPFILTYLAAISSILGVYIILRFMHFTIEGEVIPCSDCGVDLEIVKINGETAEVCQAEVSEEDWGE